MGSGEVAPTGRTVCQLGWRQRAGGRLFGVLMTTFLPMPAVFAADIALIRNYAKTRGFQLGRPVAPQITPDGRRVLFLRAAGPSPCGSATNAKSSCCA
jgi:hypothetical protein